MIPPCSDFTLVGRAMVGVGVGEGSLSFAAACIVNLFCALSFSVD